MADVVVYTTGYCGFCWAAKRHLDDRQVPYEEIDVTGDRAARRALAKKARGRTTVPQIFIGGRSIGGYTELRALDRRGELDTLLAA